MVLHVTLYLALVLSGIALIALILLWDTDSQRGVEPPAALRRASNWSGALFLGSAAALLVVTEEGTGSLLAGSPGLPSPDAPAESPGSEDQ